MLALIYNNITEIVNYGRINALIVEIISCNLLINLKGNFFEPAVGSRPNFNRMCG